MASITDFGGIEIVVIILAFVAFLYIANKAVNIFIKVLWISIISAVFPLIMNQFFNSAFALDLETFLFFIAGGIALYLLYIVVKIVYSALTITEKVGKTVLSPLKRDEIGKLKKKVKELEEKKAEPE